MAMSSKTLPNDFTLGHFKGCKECCGTMALVIMSHGSTAAFFQRKSRLRTIQGLNLTFLIHTEHQCFLWRIQIQTHNIRQFLQKFRIPGQFECFCPVWLKAMTLPDPINRCLTYAMLFGHRTTTPVRCSQRLGLQCSMDNVLDLICRYLWLSPTTWRHFPKAVRSLLREALPPQSNCFHINLHILSNKS